LGIADLDFATIHVYPSKWGVPSGTCLAWLNNDWIGDRAALAAAAGKPLILEARDQLARHLSYNFSCYPVEHSDDVAQTGTVMLAFSSILRAGQHIALEL
jgi:hypothetical protein